MEPLLWTVYLTPAMIAMAIFDKLFGGSIALRESASVVRFNFIFRIVTKWRGMFAGIFVSRGDYSKRNFREFSCFTREAFLPLPPPPPILTPFPSVYLSPPLCLILSPSLLKQICYFYRYCIVVNVIASGVIYRAHTTADSFTGCNSQSKPSYVCE